MLNLKSYTAIALVALLAGCVSPPPAHDYTAFKQADPHSVIILPPLNNTPEVIAPYSVTVSYTHLTLPTICSV